MGASYVDLEKFSHTHYSSTFSIIAAGMVIFVAYEGFELIANTLKPDIVSTALLSLILANSINLAEIAIIGSASFLLVFSIVNYAAWKKASAILAAQWITLTAFLSSSFALAVLMHHTYESNTRAVIVFLVFIALSFTFEYVYGKHVRGHFLGRAYKLQS